MLDKEFIKFLLIEGLCNGELEEDFQKDKNNLDKWVDMWYDEYIEKKERKQYENSDYRIRSD